MDGNLVKTFFDAILGSPEVTMYTGYAISSAGYAWNALRMRQQRRAVESYRGDVPFRPTPIDA